jgi:hypothetical protein
MRLRVRIDVRRPLKKDKKIKNMGGEWCIVNFKYEKLGVFCFVCGVLGHSENKCEVRFAMENDDGNREWSSDLRAESRRRGGRPTSRWLNEEGGSSGTVRGGSSSGPDYSAGRHTVDPTHPYSPAAQPIGNPQSALIIPTVSMNRPAPIQEINSQLSNQPNITDPHQSIVSTPQSLTINNMSPTLLFPNNDHPHPINPFLDNPINGQSLSIKNSATPSLSLSQNVTEAISQPFSFTSPAVAHLKQINMQLNRPVELKTYQKINRPSNSFNRTGPTKNSTEPKPKLDRNSNADMEIQLEKKGERRRRRIQNHLSIF